MRLLLLLLLLLPACAHFPLNPPLDRWDGARGGYRFENLTRGIANTDSLLVCLSFSGGGTRASALSYGVLQRLSQTRIAGGSQRLIDEVDVISASSGGAFAAAYLGLFGIDAFLRDFPDRVLARDLGMEIFWHGTLNPYNAVRLLSPWFNRSDLAAELYADTIFGQDTYTHLLRRGRPFVVLSGTDLSGGDRFEFTQDQFDLLGSSLGLVPISRAVAASSAFPFLLTPVAFVNHPNPGGFRLPPAVLAALEDGRDERGDVVRASALDRTRYRRAWNQARLVREKQRHGWVHVTDAGVVDNLGLGWVLDSWRGGAIRTLLDEGRVSTLVIIVVNARNRPPDDMGDSPRAPGVLGVLARSLTAAIDQQAFGLTDLLLQLRDQRAHEADGAPGAPALHVVEIDLEDLPDPARRERLLAVETTFGLEPEVVDDLIAAGSELLDRSVPYRQLEAALR